MALMRPPMIGFSEIIGSVNLGERSHIGPVSSPAERSAHTGEAGGAAPPLGTAVPGPRKRGARPWTGYERGRYPSGTPRARGGCRLAAPVRKTGLSGAPQVQ